MLCNRNVDLQMIAITLTAIVGALPITILKTGLLKYLLLVAWLAIMSFIDSLTVRLISAEKRNGIKSFLGHKISKTK